MTAHKNGPRFKVKPKERTELTNLQLEDLSDMQKAFCIEYIKDMNATRAARVAGYPQPNSEGIRLLRDPIYWRVQQLIKDYLEDMRKEAQIEGMHIIRELCKIAFLKPQDMLDKEGKVLAFKDIPEDVMAAVSSMTVTYSESPDGDGNFVRMKHIDIKFYSKLEALKQLALHLGLVGRETNNYNTNQVVINWQDLWGRVQGADPVEERLAQAREVQKIPAARTLGIEMGEEGEVVEPARVEDVEVAPGGGAP